MRAIELVKFCDKILKTLSNSGINTSDCRYINLFDEYEDMVLKGEKTTFAVARLSERYNISERSVYRIIRRFKSTATI